MLARLWLAAVVLLWACDGDVGKQVRALDGFTLPESIVHDVERDVYLVSNIGRDGVPGDGFVARVDAESGAVTLRWIDSSTEGATLDDPKGLAIRDGELLVTDVTVVRRFELATGRPLGVIGVAGAVALNDIAVGGDGSLYLSDSSANRPAVLRLLKDGSVQRLASGQARVGQANGLVARGDTVLVADFAGDTVREVPSGKPVATLPGKRLDGLALSPTGRLIASSWRDKAVYLERADGQFDTLASELTQPADIAVDAKRGHVLVPQTTPGRVVVIALP